MVLWSDLPFYDFLAVDARRYGCKMSFVDQGRVQAQWVNKTIPVLCEDISKFVSSAFPLVICLCPRGASVFAGWLSLSRELPVPALCSYFVHPSCNHSATPVSSTCWLEVTEESTHGLARVAQRHTLSFCGAWAPIETDRKCKFEVTTDQRPVDVSLFTDPEQVNNCEY